MKMALHKFTFYENEKTQQLKCLPFLEGKKNHILTFSIYNPHFEDMFSKVVFVNMLTNMLLCHFNVLCFEQCKTVFIYFFFG